MVDNLPQITISSATWQFVYINCQRYMAPPCFLRNVIYRGFITNITIHSHPEAIIYLFFISIGQKSTVSLAGSLLRGGPGEPESSWTTSSAWAGQKSAPPGSQGNSQTSARSACVYAKDKHQQGLLGIAKTGEISMPVPHRNSDYPTPAAPLEFTRVGRYWHPVPPATTQLCGIHCTTTHNHLVQNAKTTLQEI